MFARHSVGRGHVFWMCLASSAGGALAAYFMDDQQGRRRRHILRDRALARWRRLGRGMLRRWRGAAAETYGMSHRIVHLVPRTTDVADDETLCQRVESQLFRDRHIPKGNLNISCEHGLVILRGELETEADIEHIESRVRRVHGVRGVQNLLHPQGTPAPNKQRSLAH
ncbi:MAG TPA: BON domain-containing protein [Chloroflexota bacterium]|nr:BON domain-containing protein [Chloroflexota bacterium]